MTSPAPASKPNVIVVVFDGNPMHDWIELFSVNSRALLPHIHAIASLPLLFPLAGPHA
jgi:hypothetical protein